MNQIVRKLYLYCLCNERTYLALSWQVPPTPPGAGLPLQARPDKINIREFLN